MYLQASAAGHCVKEPDARKWASIIIIIIIIFIIITDTADRVQVVT